MPMQYWGSKKNNMLLCIVKECNNCIPYEKAWKDTDTLIYAKGFNEGGHAENRYHHTIKKMEEI
jgi:hypothetical protein